MKIGWLLAAGSMLLSGAAWSADAVQWDYSGKNGPDNWATLSPDYSACAGRNQSPIDLTAFIDAKLEPISFDYQDSGDEIVNTGHTVQINAKGGSSIRTDGVTFNLKQVHFHAPSENQINGKSFPLEAHFVHADKDGNLAVVAVMFNEDLANEALAMAWQQLPGAAGNKFSISPSLSQSKLLPADRDYYRFNGSLTTPPCTEGVRWLVMKTPVTASKAQIEAFNHVIHHANNRPVQKTNARVVLE